MKVEINAATVPDDAKVFATIGLVLYEVPSDKKTHAAAPYEVYVGASRFQVLLVHRIMHGFGRYFARCKGRAKKDEKGGE